MHGSDFGLFQLAEVLGMKQVIFVKDEDGLYDKDPKKHTDAKPIRQDHARRADDEPAEENILDRELFHAWHDGEEPASASQIVNGLVPGQLTRALARRGRRHRDREGGRAVS